MKYIYGPVPSWRLGISLGIDLISTDKTCGFDCMYCQVGKTIHHTNKRQIFVPTKKIIAEFKKLPNLKIDYITFSGSGEPTQAKNLGEVIRELRQITKNKIAVLTNSTLMHDKKVRRELALADLVVAKLDAADEKTFRVVNKPARGVTFSKTLAGIRKFKREYPKKLALQIMFSKENKIQARKIAKIAKQIKPIAIYINTPSRKCNVAPLKKEEINAMEKLFAPLKVFSLYESKPPKVSDLDKEATQKRRPEN